MKSETKPIIKLLKWILMIGFFAIVHPNTLRNDNTGVENYIKCISRGPINPRYRMHYHITPPIGWLSDPDGFVYFKGYFHIFYQFYAYNAIPNFYEMSWGHATSPNLIDWTTLPVALVPDDEVCFSGGAVVDGDTLVLMYAGRIWDDSGEYNETQYLAYSKDGTHFTKYDANPVLTMTPNNCTDFRDPKMWKHGEHWYAIIGSKSDDDLGRVLLYKSPDLIHWDFLRIMAETTDKAEYMWECPDLFEMNGRHVFLWSPQGMTPVGDRFKNIHQIGYIIGHFCYDTCEFTPETEFQELDFGHDFYASQTCERNGKRYVVAWFSAWSKPYKEEEDGWVGCLTMFRELTMVGDRLHMNPVEETITLRMKQVMNGELQSNDALELELAAEVIISADIEEKIELLVTGCDEGEKAWIRWDPEVGKVVVDRDGDVRQVEWSPIGSHSWRLFLDTTSMELFCGEGEVVFSSRLFPINNWKITNISPQVVHIEAYKLRRSVPL